MRTVHPSSLLKSLAFCAVFALLSTGCTKEELIAPVSTGVVKTCTPPPPPGDGTVGNPGGTDTGISDDGDDQGDNEKGRKKR